jgi:hypothetical protein
VDASNSKTRGKGTAKGRPLRGLEFMSELKPRPTKREAGASRRLFTRRGGLADAAPTALVGSRDVGRAPLYDFSGERKFSCAGT